MAPLMDRIFRNVYPQNDGEKIALFYTPGKKETDEQIVRRKWFRLAGALSLVCLLLGCFTLMGRNHKNASAVLHSAGIIDRYPRIDSRLIFVDDFDGDAIDDTKWTVEEDLGGGGNGEVQFYRNHHDNIGVANGMLYIKPGRLTDLGDVETPAGTYPIQEVMTGDCEPWPGCANFLLAPDQCTNALWGGCNKTGNVPPGNVIQPATSGRLNSNGKFSFQYGRIEVRARLPRGNWLWPAIWMLPTVFTYGNWPTSGEIDLVESRGNDPGYRFGGKPAGRNFAGQTLHFGPAETRTGDGWPHAHAELRSPPARGDFTEDFYTYGAYWAEDAMYLYIVDPGGVEHLVLDLTQGFANGFWEPPLGFAGRPKWKNVTMANPYTGRPLNAPYDKPFYLIMNVAVGGELYWDSPWDAACKEELRAAAEEGAGSPPPCSSNRWFYDHEDAWWPSWQAAGAQNTMEVDWVKVWQ